MIRAEAIDNFNEVFDKGFGFIEQIDLSLRILHSWKAGYIDAPLAEYRMHEKSWTFNKGMFFPKETEILIEKCLRLYPDFMSIYYLELEARKNRVAYEKFFSYWRNGDSAMARTFIRLLLKISPKFKISNCLSFFYFSFYLLLRNLIAKNYYSI